VLLLRSPCYHTCQARRLRVCAKAPEGLGHLNNVVVLSTAVDRAAPSDAELMGGDYDGDQVLLIWDERIVGAVGEAPSHVAAEALEPPAGLERVGEVPRHDLPERMLSLERQASVAHANFRRLCCLRRDWAEGPAGFGSEVEQLARLCLLGVDCAATGIALEVPEALRRHPRPHWATGGRSHKDAFVSARACGRLWEFKPEASERLERTSLLAAELLQMARWPLGQLGEAVSLVRKRCCEVQHRLGRIRSRPLSAALKRDAELALKRRLGEVGGAVPELPDGLLGAAAYVAYVSARAGSETLPEDCRAAAREALQGYLEACSGQGSAAAGQEALSQTPVISVRLLWDLFENEVLNTVAGAKHGCCPHSVGEEFMADPATEIRFTHREISSSFRHGGLLSDSWRVMLCSRIAEDTLRKRDFPMIRVRWFRGHYYSLANRRLALFRLLKFCQPAGKCSLIKVIRISDAEARRWGWRDKFDIEGTEGRSVFVRHLDWTVHETAEETTMQAP